MAKIDQFAGEKEEMLRVIGSYGMTNSLVLGAMIKVPRHRFVDKKYWGSAYDDAPVPIGFGQTMSQPYTVAFMTELVIGEPHFARSTSLRALRGKKVLEIGTGSGYQAAVLAQLFGEVYTVEIIPELARKAQIALKKLQIANVYVKTASGQYGWKDRAPFDAIIVTAGASNEKQLANLFSQLKIGGVLVAPVGPRHLQKMTRYTKLNSGKIKSKEFGNFVFVPFVKS